MEFNINSRQTQDILRGAPSYRPSFNAYMWADAKAIAKIAAIAGQDEVALQYSSEADDLKAKLIQLCWDEKRQFFFPVLRNDEHRDGHTMKALTKTYESGQFAGDTHGRELIGYVPWQFQMFKGETRFDTAWKKLMDRDGFYADFGPSFVERNDPMFLITNSCCWWSGQSWPYATTQTLKALANALQGGSTVLESNDYTDLLSIYARSHRKNGKPYLAEALHPDSGSFEGYDNYNHSEHYFHSGYCDLVITGLVGLMPRGDNTLEIHPLAPADWDYFALDAVPYRGHLLTILWDRTGTRYNRGIGMQVLVDGKSVGNWPTLQHVRIEDAVRLEKSTESKSLPAVTRTNFAVNNDGTYFPRLTTSFTSSNSSESKLNDGNYWYLQQPPNRWTCEGSPNSADQIELDFGVDRIIDTVKFYVLDDEATDAGSPIRAPQQIRLEAWSDGRWQAIDSTVPIAAVEGHRPYTFEFQPRKTAKLRATLIHQEEGRSGLTEFEAWGNAVLPLDPVAPPVGNLAYNDGSQEFPRATASHHDRFGGVPKSAIDGITNFLPTPTNRWTSYESKTETDWLEIDFGQPVEFRRVDLAIYDDRGGVQPPTSYKLQTVVDGNWIDIDQAKFAPEQPAGNQWNIVHLAPATSTKLRIVFTHNRQARSGVSEVMVWNENP